MEELHEWLNADTPVGYSGAIMPFVPSSTRVVRSALQLAGVGARDIVLDLGCGDGRFCVAAVSEFAARQAVGYDFSANCLQEARRRALAAGVLDQCVFELVDIWARLKDGEPLVPLDITVIVLFVNDRFLAKMESAIIEAVARGVRVVTYAYHFQGIRPISTARRGALQLYAASSSVEGPAEKLTALPAAHSQRQDPEASRDGGGVFGLDTMD